MMEVDFEKAQAAVEVIGSQFAGTGIDLCDEFDAILSTLDAAKAEIARLHKVIDKDTTSLDDHIASEQRALKEVARLTNDLSTANAQLAIREANKSIDWPEHFMEVEKENARLTALSEQQDRVQKELPERIVAFLEEKGILLQEYSEYGDLLIDIQPKHFAEIIAAAMKAAKGGVRCRSINSTWE